MSNLTYKHISNLSEAEAAWKTLSPNKVIYDDWDFRYAYYKYFNFPLDFIVAYQDEKLVGVLPLMWDPNKNHYDFFAGFGYMEDNAIFVKEGFEGIRPELLKRVSGPTLLEFLRPDMATLPGIKPYDQNYYIELNGMENYQDFIQKYLSSDGRRNINSQIRKLNSENAVEITYDNLEDMKVLEYWNKVRFGNTSSFNERPHWDEFFNEIVQKYESKIITVSINGKREGVGFVILYSDICFGFNAGYNPQIKNLGKFITLLKIDAGIKAKKRIYDAAGSGAFGWKEDFNLLKRPQYCIDLTSSPATKLDHE